MPIQIKDRGDSPWEELPSQQQDFVLQYVQIGNAIDAAVKAGYNDDAKLPNKARKLREYLSNHIDDKTKEFVESTDMTLLGAHTLKALAQSADSETVKLNAAKEILNRTMPEKKTSVIEHKHTVKRLDDSKLDERINLLQEKLGRLGGNVIDVKAEA